MLYFKVTQAKPGEFFIGCISPDRPYIMNPSTDSFWVQVVDSNILNTVNSNFNMYSKDPNYYFMYDDSLTAIRFTTTEEKVNISLSKKIKHIKEGVIKEISNRYPSETLLITLFRYIEHKNTMSTGEQEAHVDLFEALQIVYDYAKSEISYLQSLGDSIIAGTTAINELNNYTFSIPESILNTLTYDLYSLF